MTKIEIRCAWCQKHLGTKDGKGTKGISHGICPECREKVLKEIDRGTVINKRIWRA